MGSKTKPFVTYEPRLDRESRDGWDTSIHIHEGDHIRCISIASATELRDALTAALDRAKDQLYSVGPLCHVSVEWDGIVIIPPIYDEQGRRM